MIEEYEKYYNPKTYYVIEGNLLDAELALELHRKSDVDVVFVGMPKNNPNILFERIRLNALKYSCWTNKYSDSELLIRCQEIIEQRKKE